MLYFGILLAVVNAYLLARYARKHFATTLASAFALSAVSVGAYVGAAFKYNLFEETWYWGVMGVFALLIFLLSNPLRFFWAWLISLSLLIYAVMIPFNIEVSKTSAVVFTLVALIPVIVFRKEIKMAIAGLMSGMNAAMALILLMFAVVPIGENASKIASVIYLAGVVAGVFFQFKLYDQYFGEKLETPQ